MSKTSPKCLLKVILVRFLPSLLTLNTFFTLFTTTPIFILLFLSILELSSTSLLREAHSAHIHATRPPERHCEDAGAHLSHARPTSAPTQTTCGSLGKHLSEWIDTLWTLSTTTRLHSTERLFEDLVKTTSLEELSEDLIRIEGHATVSTRLLPSHVVVTSFTRIAKCCVGTTYFLEGRLRRRCLVLVRVHFQS